MPEISSSDTLPSYPVPYGSVTPTTVGAELQLLYLAVRSSGLRPQQFLLGHQQYQRYLDELLAGGQSIEWNDVIDFHSEGRVQYFGIDIAVVDGYDGCALAWRR